MPRSFAISVAGISAACLLGTWSVRARDTRQARKAWAALAAQGMRNATQFAPEMVASLSEPARRYFTFAIAPGTPLRTVAEIDMLGEIGLGERNKPNYQAMTACEILAPPHGFVWMPRIGSVHHVLLQRRHAGGVQGW
jgi:hypothetical protein